MMKGCFRIPWSDEELIHLRAFYADVSNKSLAIFLNKTYKSVSEMARKKKLKKSEIYLHMIGRNNNGRNSKIYA